jgi:hypothetical protein
MTQLSPVQIACVTALFFATSIGALLLAWGFRNAAQHEERSDVLANLADAIESGDHIKETEDEQ